MKRCDWAKGDPLYEQYHDLEWGVPQHDDRKLFEFVILEGVQAGLSWITVLKRREHYRQAMAEFDPNIIAAWGEVEIAALLQNKNLIRNRLKMEAAVKNASAFLKVQAEFGSFDKYLWSFVQGNAIQNHWESIKEIPAETPVSKALSRDLKKRGFSFVGPTICYALMQAVGMVNDHVVSCFRHQELAVAPISSTSAV
jgi:DNA-3-methyladenine glycosylase I